jgi:hypothetical protein
VVAPGCRAQRVERVAGRAPPGLGINQRPGERPGRSVDDDEDELNSDLLEFLRLEAGP